MLDCMLDLETYGTHSNAVVASIGAVFFSKDEVSKHGFYAVLDTPSQVIAGRVLDAGTVEWWLQQSEEARAIAKAPKKEVTKVLEDFASFLGDGDVKVWGNGADFDCVILGSLYESFGIKRPWSYGNNRCFRTLKNITTRKIPERKGVAHNALHDAIYQAQCAQVYLKGKLK